MQAEYPELIKLILATESMDDEERQYWFDIMPSMNDSQVDRLFNILETERRKLEELELKYQEEIKSLNEKHLIEWQEFQTRDARGYSHPEPSQHCYPPVPALTPQASKSPLRPLPRLCMPLVPSV